MSDSNHDFFETPREHSKVKAQIVSKYVQTWARVLSDYLRHIRRVPELAYVDLFSGPGTYNDGTSSTPMLVLKSAADDSKVGMSLRTYFNDLDSENIATLGEAIKELPGLEQLKYEPKFYSEQATLSLVRSMNVPVDIPKLYFLDQFGYKSVTFELIQNLMSEWAECIFFFNYRRVIAAIDNPTMMANVLGVFGSAERLSALKRALVPIRTANDREQVVMSHLIKALNAARIKFVQPFAFKVEDGHRSTHHLIFLSNHSKGYTIMKGIMAREGTQSDDGLPYLTYIQKQTLRSGNLFAPDWVAELGLQLCQTFPGKTLTLKEVFEQHSRENNFLPAHYREALLRLEAEEKITTLPNASSRPKSKGMRTMAITTRVTFHGGQ